MICVTVARHSRRLAFAGLLNAARMAADLVEVRLDTFEHEPDPEELLLSRRTPLMFSCLRAEEGGQWKGTEEERLTLLRRAILTGPEYVAIEHDVADQIPRHGTTKRVICYTNTEEVPADLDQIAEQCSTLDADIIRITCKARTPEEAWPLLQLLVKPPAPMVVVGLGWAGLMPALIGRKYGAPWTSACLERGTEAYPGQPTVRDLLNVYHYHHITRETSWVGVTGMGQWEVLTAALLNSAFIAQGSSKRCLPTPVGDVAKYRKFAERANLQGVVVGRPDQEQLRAMAEGLDENVRFPSESDESEELESAVDVLVPDENAKWCGGSIFPKAALAALRRSLARRNRTLEGTVVMFVGLTPATIGLAHGVKKRGGILIFADRDQKAAEQYCRWFGGRHIRPEAIYSTLHDVLILCASPAVSVDDELEEPALHPGCLKPGLTVLDLTALPKKTPLLAEAAKRGCYVVEPLDLLYQYVRRLGFRLRGEEAAKQALKEAIRNLLADALISSSDFTLPGEDAAESEE